MDNPIIKSLEIKNLWSRLNGTIPFNDDINIIIGKNGTGKSTVLDLIISVLTKTNPRKIDIEKSRLVFKDGNSIEYKRVKKDINSDIPFELNIENVDDLLSILKKNILNQINNQNIEQNQLKINFNEEDIEDIEDIASQDIKIIKISTFDMELKNRKSNVDKDKKFIRTELDIILHDLIEEFKLYQYQLKSSLEAESEKIDLNIKLLNNQSSILNKKDNELLKELDLLKALVEEKRNKKDEIFYFKEKFKNIIYNLFKDTDKEVFIDENNSINFRIIDNQKKEHIITPYDLSSGEKQMLSILLRVLLTKNKFCILMMDEPEMSLHVEWQNTLISNLRDLNSNMQIFISTHSPAIVTKGWKNKIIKIQDYLK